MRAVPHGAGECVIECFYECDYGELICACVPTKVLWTDESKDRKTHTPEITATQENIFFVQLGVGNVHGQSLGSHMHADRPEEPTVSIVVAYLNNDQ